MIILARDSGHSIEKAQVTYWPEWNRGVTFERDRSGMISVDSALDEPLNEKMQEGRAIDENLLQTLEFSDTYLQYKSLTDKRIRVDSNLGQAMKRLHDFCTNKRLYELPSDIEAWADSCQTTMIKIMDNVQAMNKFKLSVQELLEFADSQGV